MRRYLIYALAIVAVVSCKKDDSQTYIESGDNIVSFSSANTITRTTQLEQDGEIVDGWESGDRVGITTIGFSSDYENIEYEATTSQDATTTSLQLWTLKRRSTTRSQRVVMLASMATTPTLLLVMRGSLTLV